jgi:hypothetical protein
MCKYKFLTLICIVNFSFAFTQKNVSCFYHYIYLKEETHSLFLINFQKIKYQTWEFSLNHIIQKVGLLLPKIPLLLFFTLPLPMKKWLNLISNYSNII